MRVPRRVPPTTPCSSKPEAARCGWCPASRATSRSPIPTTWGRPSGSWRRGQGWACASARASTSTASPRTRTVRSSWAEWRSRGRGPGGHSDADAVGHVLADAVLGAVGLGDLGRHFPDTDPVWEGADSVALLTEVVAMAAQAGFVCATRTARSSRTPPGRPPYGRHGGAAERGARRPGLGQGDPGRGSRPLGRAEGIACLAVVLMESA